MGNQDPGRRVSLGLYCKPPAGPARPECQWREGGPRSSLGPTTAAHSYPLPLAPRQVICRTWPGLAPARKALPARCKGWSPEPQPAADWLRGLERVASPLQVLAQWWCPPCGLVGGIREVMRYPEPGRMLSSLPGFSTHLIRKIFLLITVTVPTD